MYTKIFDSVLCFRLICLVALLVACAGCGLTVPDQKEPWEPAKVESTLVEKIVEHVECEVRVAAQDVVLRDEASATVRKQNGLKHGRVLDAIDNWAAQITLTLTVDEKSSLNPGLSLNTPLPTATTSFSNSAPVSTMQSFALGLGGTLSADATRKDTLALYLDLGPYLSKASLARAKELREQGRLLSQCEQPKGNYLIEGDLKIDDWLSEIFFSYGVEGGQIDNFGESLKKEAEVTKKDAISHEVTFVVLYGGSITPTWKLVRISANQGSTPFFGAQRTKTQDLVVTFGTKQGKTLSQSAQNTILAAQIGQAVASAIRSTQ